jgi:hypothetical protein
MKIKEPPPIPDWLDLGPLDSVGVGSEVVTLRIKSGRVYVSPQVMRVRLLEGWRTLVEGAGGKPLGGWQTKFKGACLSMGGVYYYSTNPKHIATACTLASNSKKRAQAKAAEYNRRMELAKEAGEILGDGWQEPCDDGWHSSAVSDALVSRLTDMQIRQLTKWLKR